MEKAQRAFRQLLFLRISEDEKDRAMKETGWADGLRGLAALFVVSSHVVLCYARGIIPPCCSPESTKPYLFQKPILRLVASGHSWVAIFFILMGYVNALKPLQLARSGQVDKAWHKLGSSALGRVLRLVLPATVATVASWFICNLGLYKVSVHSDAFWLQNTTPEASPDFIGAFSDLVYGLKATWLYGEENPYDQPQWALVYLLQGSIMVISALSLVVSMTPTWRTLSLLFLSYWSLNWSQIIGDPWTGLCCFCGITLGELSLSNFPTKLAHYSSYLSPPIILAALTFMSYPGSFAEAATWSTWLRDFAMDYLPSDTVKAIDRMYGSLGGLMLIFGIIISPHARWLLSRPPMLWLGKVSFAIYLLHGMFMRTIFAWLLHIGTTKRDLLGSTDKGIPYIIQRYPLPGKLQCACATIVMIICVGIASHFWNAKLEPFFARTTSAFENVVKDRTTVVEPKTNGSTILPLRKD